MANRHQASARMGGGFSLVELLVALSVVAILASLALPSFARSLAQTRVADATSAIYSAVVLTRSEALKRRIRIVMCSSSDGSNCSVGSGWSAGWLIFEDRNDDGIRDAGEEIIRVQGAQSGVTTTGNGPMRDYVSYVASGRTQQLGGGLLMGTLTVCSDDLGRAIVINHAGRPRVAEATCE